MTPLRLDTDIRLAAGYSEYLIDTDRDITLTFTNTAADADVFLKIRRCGTLTLRTFTTKDAKVNYLFWNESEQPLKTREYHEVMGGAALRIAYGECGPAAVDRSSSVSLREPGAYALVSSAALVRERKDWVMDIVSHAPDTTGIMENYAVVLKGGYYRMQATGKIVKGAHGSQSHQSSRALCFDEGQTSTILPQLLIDEHDVQASHATSVGRVDEDQLYYMQSRGLSTKQVTALISTGYLMPIAEFIDNETLKKTLQEQLEGKITQICSL
jgi:Fe-S cluster assembly protein SufD